MIEHRLAADIVCGAQRDGFVVSGEWPDIGEAVWKQHQAANPIFHDGPDDHGIVTVDLELGGMTLEEYSAENRSLDGLRERVRFHRWRLLHDNMRLWETYLEICADRGIPEVTDDMNAGHCVIALQLL